MFLIAIALVLLIAVVPVMVGAHLVGARNKTFGVSFAAIVIGYLLVWLAALHFRNLGLLAIFITALVYMLVLGTTYLRGLGIVLIQYVLTILIVFVLLMTSLGAMLHVRGMLRQLPIDIPRVHSI
jgi:hypothetical protein